MEHTAPPDTAAPAYADLECMEQVVSNLMSNAIKFTPPGGHVTVRIDEAEAETRVLVSDTGIGVAEANREAIFERSQRVDGSSTRAHEGTGIGLALTKDLVEAHGGRITVDSALGEGATFTVLLPSGRNALPKRHRLSTSKRPETSAADPSPLLPDSESASGDADLESIRRGMHWTLCPVVLFVD